jgi:hypothetical protein
VAAFYLDEDVARAIDYELRILGHNIVNVRDLGLKGELDAVHLANAAQQSRVLVTRNRHDFENLHAAWQHWSWLWAVTPLPEHRGVLVIPDWWRPLEAAQELDSFVTAGTPLTNSLYRYDRQRGWLAWS